MLAGCGRYCCLLPSSACVAKNATVRQNGLSAGRARRKSIASRSFFCVTWMRVPSGCVIQCVPFASADAGESYSVAGNLPLCHLPMWPTQ